MRKIFFATNETQILTEEIDLTGFQDGKLSNLKKFGLVQILP
jgi:hypothetical protein